MQLNPMEIIMAVLGALTTIVGWSIAKMLSNIEHSIKELTKGLQDTSIDLAGFISKTEAVLDHHSKRLDSHQETIENIRYDIQ